MKRILIVEDDAENNQMLREYLEGHGYVCTQAFSGSEGKLLFSMEEFDLILLDVQMQFLDGMAAAREIRRIDREVIIIFITNMAQYAIQGYAVDALDYVLKPVSYFALSQRLNRAIARLKQRKRTYVAVPVKGGVRKLDTAQIYYVESQDHVLTFHTSVGEVVSTITMRQAEERLSDAHFFRGNNSYLINLEHVDGVQDGCAVVRGELLKLSRPRKNAFLEAVSNYLGEVLK